MIGRLELTSVSAGENRAREVTIVKHVYARLSITAGSILLAAALSACGTSGSSGSNSNSGGGSSTAGLSAGTDPKGDVIKAYRLQATKPYRLRETTTMSGQGGNQTFSRVLEVVPPDRFHAMLDKYESITIGDVQYTRVNGTWSQSSRPDKRNVSGGVGKLILQQIESGALVITYIGRDTADGKAAQLYEMSGTLKIGDTEMKGQRKVWISVSEGLPLKYAGKSESPYAMESVLTYEYDPGIKIEAPM